MKKLTDVLVVTSQVYNVCQRYTPSFTELGSSTQGCKLPRKTNTVGGTKVEDKTAVVLQNVTFRDSKGTTFNGISLADNKPWPSRSDKGFGPLPQGVSVSSPNEVGNREAMKYITFIPESMNFKDTDNDKVADSFRGQTISGQIYDVNLLNGTYKQILPTNGR